jgi:hypothetical protein
MKSNKNFTLDREIIDELKKDPNGSKLVNDLLKNHFQMGQNNKEIINQKIFLKETEGRKIQEDITTLKEKLKIIENKDKERKEMLKDIPQEILDDLKNFQKMTLKGFKERHPDFNEIKLEKAYKEYHG